MRTDAGMTDAGRADSGFNDAGPSDAGSDAGSCVGNTMTLLDIGSPPGQMGWGAFTSTNLPGSQFRQADDFTVPDGGPCWCIETVEVRGFTLPTEPLPPGVPWRVEIYRGTYNGPYGPVPQFDWATYSIPPTVRDGGVVRFHFSYPLVIGTGSHWLSAEPETHYDYDGGAHFPWYWAVSTDPVVGSPHAYTSLGGFGSVEGEWASGTSIGPASDLSFRLEGRLASVCP
jgi:hypothetical protein